MKNKVQQLKFILLSLLAVIVVINVNAQSTTNYIRPDSCTSSTAGVSQTAIGYGSQCTDIAGTGDGTGNTSVGNRSLYTVYNGHGNTAMGAAALYNEDADGNTALGDSALYTDAIGGNNTAVGYKALYNNLNGSDQEDGFFPSDAFGNNACYSQTTANGNVGIGSGALFGNTTGNDNVAVGHGALIGNTMIPGNLGSSNTALGYEAGAAYVNYANCTFLGYEADRSSSSVDYTDQTAIGYEAIAPGNNKMQLCDASCLGVYTASGNYLASDGRFKKDIRQNVPGLEFIKRLSPVTYHYDMHAMDKFIYGNKSETYEKEMADGIAAKEKVLYTGFIAQEVEKSAKELNYDFSGISAPKNDKQYYALSYENFVVPLVKAVQEQQQMIETQSAIIQSQAEQLQAIENQLQSLQNCCYGTGEDKSSINPNSNKAALLYAAPNPTANATTIYYYAPQTAKTIRIEIKDKQGASIQTLPVSNSGYSSVNVETTNLASGVYFYSLIVDDQIIDTKKLVIILK